MASRPTCECGPDALSPSQIDTFRSCARKWGFRKLAGQVEAETKAQAAGKEIHDMLEKYALTGELPDRATVKFSTPVWRTIPYLPKPDPAHRCEQHMRLNLVGGITIHGYPDLMPAQGGVVDYKTVSVRTVAFEFAHTPETLMADTQVAIYGFYALTKHPLYSTAPSDVKLTIGFKWIYIERARPFRVRVVEITLNEDQLSASMEGIRATAEKMLGYKRAAAEKSGQDKLAYVNEAIPANSEFCGAYGGCPHAAICAAYVMPSKEKENMSDVNAIQARIAEMNAKKKGGRGTSPATDNVPTVTQARTTRQPDPINPPIEDMEAGTVPDETDQEGDEETVMLAKLERIRAAKQAKAEAEERARAETAETPPKNAKSFHVNITITGDTISRLVELLRGL
jgi:hypothetical protein